MGTTDNRENDYESSEQAQYNRCRSLEELYPGSRIDSVGIDHTDCGVTALSPRCLAWPNFSKVALNYETHAQRYGPIRAEVYPSQDERLLWTYYRQPGTKRAWVAFAHQADEKMKETGLPFMLVNVGNAIPLPPYERPLEVGGAKRLKAVPGTRFVDIWEKYTSKNPLVKAYYEARQEICPK